MKHNQVEPSLPLHLKIGLNTGEPIAEDDDLFGTVVQLSARIVDKATADKIYVSEIVRGICAGKTYKFKSLGGFNMKGFGDEINLFEVLWK
jgi:adenylate cyclase